MKPWYHIDNINQLDSPALVVYPERVKTNIKHLISMVDEIGRLRPHVKTHKSIEATQLLLEAGILKFKCATIAEAEMLAMAGAKDILLAYQPIGPKMQRFIRLCLKYPSVRFSCLVDDRNIAAQIGTELKSAGIKMAVYLDVNVGMNRTGVSADERAIQLYLDCSGFKNIEPVGLHVYDGHLRNTDITIRTQQCNDSFSHIERIRDKLMTIGYPEPIIVAGGSPTFYIHAKRKKVECSPGTFIYWDKGYQLLCPEQPFEPAALVITRIISMPAENILCLDLGHKSIASENEISKRVYFLNAPQLKPLSQSEEHFVVQTDSTHSYKPGDVFYGLPFHICPTCALYERAYTIEDHKVKGEWKVIARDRVIGV